MKRNSLWLGLGLLALAPLMGCNEAGSWEDVAEGNAALGAAPESQCGPSWDVQNVEQYNGTLGVTADWVRRHESAVGYQAGPGCSGTLIGPNLFISAGHCDYAVGQIVRFNYQLAPNGTSRPVTDTTVTEVVEQSFDGTWDYAIVRLSGNPGNTFGYARIGNRDPAVGSLVAVIQHPNRVAKVIHTGPVVDYSSSIGANWFRHAVDTIGGSSGSGVLTPDGYLVGIHTNAGCSTGDPVGGNSAIRMTRLLTHSATLRALAAGKCTGTTVAGATAWQQYSADSLFVDVDTTACGYTATPAYFTNLGGTTNHWTTAGATSIYSATATGFRVYLSNLGAAVTPAVANSRGWTIGWEAEPKGLRGTTLCTDSTTAGSTNWVQYSDSGLYVDVNTAGCGFTTAPNYVTSLGGNSSHWRNTGASSIYTPTSTGFRVYLRYLDGAITPATANSLGWHLNWRATPAAARTANNCTGATSPSSWVQYSSNGLYVDVNTAACGMDWTPQVLTSFGGNSMHWTTTGATSTYSPTPTGFRVYIRDDSGAVTAADAASRGWFINWSVGR